MCKWLVSFRGSQNIRFWETGQFIVDALVALKEQVYTYGFVYETGEWFGDADLTSDYNYFLYMEMGDGASPYLELKNIKAKNRIGWFFDTALYPQKIQTLCDYLNLKHVFQANPDYVTKKDYWLPYAESTKFYRSLETPKKYDVLLVGSDRPERRLLIEKLRDAGISAHLISGIFKDDYIDTLASAKIVLNDHAGGGVNLANMRTFEAPAAGAVLAMPRISEIEKIFESDEVLIYNNTNELIDKIRDILHNNQWAEMARRGQIKVLSQHTYIERIMKIKNIIGGI